jgi:hypothetical protein
MIVIRLRRRPAAGPAAEKPKEMTPLEGAEYIVAMRKTSLEHVELRMEAARNLDHDLEPYEKAIERFSIDLEEALRLLDIEREILRIQAKRAEVGA